MEKHTIYRRRTASQAFAIMQEHKKLGIKATVEDDKDGLYKVTVEEGKENNK